MVAFTGHRRSNNPALPPGQYEASWFPVLSAGPTPRIDLAKWELFIHIAKDETYRWSWDEFLALPSEEITTDIHCVTSWSKLGTVWRGVSLDTLFTGIDTDLAYAMFHCYGGYTANLPVREILGGRSWIAYEYDGAALTSEHGGPARLLVPHLYFWKSAKWVRGIVMHREDKPGFWEQYGYHNHGDPWREERYS